MFCTIGAMDGVLGWITKNREALGILGTAVGAVVAAGWAFYKFRKESKLKSSPVDAAALPVRRAAETTPLSTGPRTAAPEPNLVVLDCLTIPIEFDEELVAREIFSGQKQAAVVVMRNDPVKGRLLARMVDTRALLTIVPDVGRTVHVAAAQWLESSLNCVDFEPGDTNKLVVAVRVPEIASPAALDDRRVLNGPDDVRPIELPAAMTRAIVTVKLVGGFHSEFVEEFRFELTANPLAIRATQVAIKPRRFDVVRNDGTTKAHTRRPQPSAHGLVGHRRTLAGRRAAT